MLKSKPNFREDNIKRVSNNISVIKNIDQEEVQTRGRRMVSTINDIKKKNSTKKGKPI